MDYHDRRMSFSQHVPEISSTLEAKVDSIIAFSWSVLFLI